MTIFPLKNMDLATSKKTPPPKTSLFSRLYVKFFARSPDTARHSEGQNPQKSDDAPLVEKPYRSLLKSISWRMTGSIDTFIIAYFVTGDPMKGLQIGGIEVVSKFILYYLHERAWSKSKFGTETRKTPDFEI